MGASISACIIARDEESRLPGCLHSVSFCDEVLVVDGGSRDSTVELARAAGAKVVEHPWRGFGAARNVAIDHATGDWILEVDADERISPALRAQIQSFVAEPPPEIRIGALPCRNSFLGAPLGPSAKYPQYRYRLFRRGEYRHDESRTVHEGLWPAARPWAFSADLDHLLAESFGEALRDTWGYARLEAAQHAPAGSARAVVVGVALRPPAKLAYRLLVDGGWHDGWRGAVKIALDCASDAMVWCRLGLRRGSAGGEGTGEHFHERARVGPVRLVAVAPAPAAEAARTWLLEAQRAGADGALITDAPVAPDALLHARRIHALRPLLLIRALDAEEQLRPIDALVPWGGRARALVRALPRALRGASPPLDPDMGPAAAERLVRERTRGREVPVSGEAPA